MRDGDGGPSTYLGVNFATRRTRQTKAPAYAAPPPHADDPALLIAILGADFAW